MPQGAAGSIIELLIDLIKSRGIQANEARHCRIRSPASAFIPGYHPPNLTDSDCASSIFLPPTSKLISQRVVANHDFHGPPDRFDNVIVEGDGLDGRFLKKD